MRRSSGRDASDLGIALHIDPRKQREPIGMLADTRYVILAVAVPSGAPLFHWQELGVDPDAKIGALSAFREQAASVLQPILTGCRYRVLSPTAFHSVLRFADRELREISLEAAIAYLKLAYDFAPSMLAAAAGLFEDPQGNSGGEVRIGLAKATDVDAVIEGVVWPLLGDDEDQTMEDVEKALRKFLLMQGVVHHSLPMRLR